MFSRIALFMATNFAVLIVLSITMNLLGLDLYAAQYGQDMTSLLVYSAIIGFAGSLISLAMSKRMAKRSTGAQIIEVPTNEEERWLMDTVARQAKQAGIGMPEVAIYPSNDVNAFATGMSRNNALVALSSGLLNTMTRDEAEAVMAHEISHVANGDMITLTLVQGVMNTFVVFFSRIIGGIIDKAISGNNDNHRPGMGYFIASMVAQMVLGVLASIVVSWFSRKREFRADEGGGDLAGNHKMAAALRRLQSLHGEPDLPKEVAAFGISGSTKSKFSALFLSHPPLEDRIAALEARG